MSVKDPLSACDEAVFVGEDTPPFPAQAIQAALATGRMYPNRDAKISDIPLL